ncbi:IS4 family transposase [Mycoavidus cysteinexigens]|uniref:IS4 family transposase n=1 Tax=Mycoavidus cysteinexigens TaxID=1553431 RepID=UPI0005EEA037|nr:IS4 family transposase [Mycoavidus cysteinexigens]GAM53680.1 hypothetical protein EBME_2143 [bacterium endosymbiont of Mortierella elongata FMR23-6]
MTPNETDLEYSNPSKNRAPCLIIGEVVTDVAPLLGRSNPEISCEVLLQPIEWQALYCRAHNTKHPPSDPPTLNQAILWIAKLGGYLARKHDLPPGPTVLWRGFMALHEATKMFQIMHQCD